MIIKYLIFLTSLYISQATCVPFPPFCMLVYNCFVRYELYTNLGNMPRLGKRCVVTESRKPSHARNEYSYSVIREWCIIFFKTEIYTFTNLLSFSRSRHELQI